MRVDGKYYAEVEIVTANATETTHLRKGLHVVVVIIYIQGYCLMVESFENHLLLCICFLFDTSRSKEPSKHENTRLGCKFLKRCYVFDDLCTLA